MRQDRCIYPPPSSLLPPSFLWRYHIRQTAAPFQRPLMSVKSGNCSVSADNLPRCDRRGLMRPLPLQASILIPPRWNTQRLGHWPTGRPASEESRVDHHSVETDWCKGGGRDERQRRGVRERGRDSAAGISFLSLFLWVLIKGYFSPLRRCWLCKERLDFSRLQKKKTKPSNLFLCCAIPWQCHATCCVSTAVF